MLEKMLCIYRTIRIQKKAKKKICMSKFFSDQLNSFIFFKVGGKNTSKRKESNFREKRIFVLPLINSIMKAVISPILCDVPGCKTKNRYLSLHLTV